MAQGHRRLIAYFTGLIVVSLPLVAALSMAQSSDEEPSQHTSLQKPDEETQKQIDECMGCHAPDAQGGPAVQVDHLMKSPHAALGCTTCHSGITETPHTPEMVKTLPVCADCHPTQSEEFDTSVHARRDKEKGDHPRCVTCHGGGDPHSVKLYSTWARKDKVAVCTNCHKDLEKMEKYGPNVGAVSSYNASFHGRALLKFGSQHTAICVDCHGSHAVKKSSDPTASTHKENVTKTCAKCHPGATKAFSVSGSSHMNLTIERDPILSGVLVFFKVLVTFMASFLVLGVLLDLRRSIFGKVPPRAGRLVGVLVSLGFLSIVVAIAQATFGIDGGRISVMVGGGLLLLSVIVHKTNQKRLGIKPEKHHDRFSTSLRVQHVLLVISFTTLILTGIPVRNPETETFRQMYMAIGGLEVGRYAHRIAGVLMISVFLFHILELLWKWKKAGFKFSSWTMLPNLQDAKDFIAETRLHMGHKVDPPEFGRFHFKGKMDYFAEYWGVPLMGITGLMLWFPVWFGSFLPPIAIPIAFIAHSYEAVLAFIAILTWHLYNSYFNPNHFAASTPWSIGILTHEDMEHVHPKEFKEIMAAKDDLGDPEVGFLEEPEAPEEGKTDTKEPQ